MTDQELDPKTCPHNGRFFTYGHNLSRPPETTCMDCGSPVRLDHALNVYFAKMDALIEAASK